MTEPRIRPVDESEIPAYRAAVASVFAFEPVAAEDDLVTRWMELDRSMVVEDGGTFVATGGALSYSMVVPGGASVKAGGLTMITVKPTHRRQGLLRAMIDRHFDDAIERSEPVSVLWASESSIYGRFGYGMAVERRSIEVKRADGALRGDIPASTGTMRLVEADEAKRLVREIYGRATSEVPGSIERREVDWEDYFSDFEHHREGRTRPFYAVYERDGAAAGYVRYRLKSSWSDQGPEGTVHAYDIQAVDGEAYAALWRYLFSIDLMEKVEAGTRPVPDPLRDLLEHPRKMQLKGYDGLWVRILDVEAALAARRYDVDGSLVLEVVDEFRPALGGRFRLQGGPEGAACERTDDPADLTITTERLAAAYLGMPVIRGLAWLGLVQGDADAVDMADRMFRWRVAAATSVHF